MSTTLEIFTSIVAVGIAVVAMLPVIKFLEKTAGWEETDKESKRIK